MTRNEKIGWTIFGLFVIATLVFFITNRTAPAPAAPVAAVSDPSQLPGIQMGNAPWPAEITNLKARLASIGLPALSSEGTALHIHQHLDIYIDGKSVAVPAGAGINEAAGFIADIHVHDSTGVIHVESPVVRTFTLGQFFDIWGVRFTSDCIGGYCASGNKTLRVYVNGVLRGGDPRTMPLAEHQEIAVVYGTSAEVPNPVPASFAFPSGD